MSLIGFAAGAWLLVAQGMAPGPTVPATPSQPLSRTHATTILDAEVGDEEPGEDEEPALEAADDAETSKLVEEMREESADAQPLTIEVKRPRASARTEDALAAPVTAPCKPDDVGLAGGVLRPSILEPRWEVGAALLGGLVGFGTGDFYAGNPRHGLVLAITDTVLLGSLAGTIWALNDHAVGVDHRTGLSLARGERDRDNTESALTGVAWGLGIAAGLSRLFQVYDGYHAAVKTNAAIRATSFVPLASLTPLRNGGAVALGFQW